MLHKLFHYFTGEWRVIEHLPVPGYTNLVRQKCAGCGTTRVQEMYVNKPKG